MKTFSTLGSVVFLLLVTLSCVHAGILAGPITNPDNGHDYYLLTQNTWSASEAEAESLGGTLALVKNKAEQEWIFTTFAAHGSANRQLWIGLHRTSSGGPFAWVDGGPTNYFDWCDGQPDNGGGVEDSVVIWTPNDGWNDARNGEQNYGVVEMPGDVRKKSLTGTEKSLVGLWYQSGRNDQPCYITATQNRLFAIASYGRAATIIMKPSGFAFIPNWNTQGEIVKDKILWSDGTWWSRTASNFGMPVPGSSPFLGTYPVGFAR